MDILHDVSHCQNENVCASLGVSERLRAGFGSEGVGCLERSWIGRAGVGG